MRNFTKNKKKNRNSPQKRIISTTALQQTVPDWIPAIGNVKKDS